jgi:ABC-type multidrug transport system ATPase subunit
VKLIKFGGKLTNTCKIISLLQPPPEVVALFDETILVSDGKIIYCGPTCDIIDHFEALGYSLPERMDVADWLQQLPTPDGAQFLTDKSGEAKHLSSEEFKERFDASELGIKIQKRFDGSVPELNPQGKAELSRRYKNSPFTSLRLVVARELLLWWRDKPAIRAKIMQGKIEHPFQSFSLLSL